MKKAILTLTIGLAVVAFAQSPAGSRSWRGLQNFTSAILRIPHSNTLPGSCNAGEVYHDDDATSGSNFYSCVGGSWVLQAGGGSGAPTNAGYLTKSADATLSNEFNLGALADNSVLAVDVSAGTATPRAGLFADIVALFGGGSCSGYIKSDGTCDSGAGGGAGFLFNCVSPTTATANATNYCIGATLNSNEGRAQFQIPRNCTLGALRVRTSSSTGAALNLAGGTLTVTVRNGASDSVLTCTVADGTSSCSDLAHTEAATAGVFTSLKLVGTNYSVAPYVQASFECQ